MSNNKYKNKAESLAKAIDIAICSFQRYPPINFNNIHLDHITNSLLASKENVLNPKPKFANMSSLKFIIDEVFTYFQENSNNTSIYFWEQIRIKNLPFERKDKLANILKNKKIKNKIEYNFIIDTIGPYIQKKFLSEEEVNLLNQIISEYEKK